MELPNINTIVSMLETSISVEGISDSDKEIVNETIQALKDMDDVGGLRTSTDMKNISDIVNDLKKRMEARGK